MDMHIGSALVSTIPAYKVSNVSVLFCFPLFSRLLVCLFPEKVTRKVEGWIFVVPLLLRTELFESYAFSVNDLLIS